MKITGNEPACPMPAFRAEQLLIMNETGILMGITIRQQFAMAAMQGMLANGMPADQGVQPPYHKNPDELVQEAVIYADLLIEELNKEI